MEDGDSDTDKYPHRTGHNAGYNQLHGTWTVLLVTKRAGGKISFGFFLFSRKSVNHSDKCLFFYDDSGGVLVSANDSDDFVSLVTV